MNNNIEILLTKIKTETDIINNRITELTNINSNLTKVLATVRQHLEKSLKNPDSLKTAVYSSINLCRENLIYMDISSEKNKKDSPLTDEEKTL